MPLRMADGSPHPPPRQVSARRVKLPMDASVLRTDPSRAMAPMLNLLIAEDAHKWFLRPVMLDVAPDYHAVIAQPMSMADVAAKIALDDGSYSVHMFEADIRLMLSNARVYNDDPRHAVHIEAARLEAQFVRILKGDVLLPSPSQAPPPPLPSVVAPAKSETSAALAPTLKRKAAAVDAGRAGAAKVAHPAKKRRAAHHECLRIVLVALERAWYPATLTKTDWARNDPFLVVFHRDGERRWIGENTPILLLPKKHDQFQTILPGKEGGFRSEFGQHVVQFDGVCLMAIAATLPYKRSNNVELLELLNEGTAPMEPLMKGQVVRLPVEVMTNA